MGGKGRRRREKNYLAAHGGNSRLPPPPNLNEHDALPSKLRRIMQLNNLSSIKHGAIESSTETGHGKKNDESSSKNSTNLKESRLGNVLAKLGGGVDKTKNNIVKEKSTRAESSSADAKKRKRKRNSAKDLRFENLDQFGKHSKRKERKKQYLKEKKNKHKKVNEDDGLDFPGREQIRFGEVVTAPPKLSFCKALFGAAFLGQRAAVFKNAVPNSEFTTSSGRSPRSQIAEKQRFRIVKIFHDSRIREQRVSARRYFPPPHLLLVVNARHLPSTAPVIEYLPLQFIPVFSLLESFPCHSILHGYLTFHPIIPVLFFTKKNCWNGSTRVLQISNPVPKTPTKASSERLRLQVIEGYRKVSGFDSRPGVKLPLPSFVETAALLTG
ncbi:hypothetical protein KSP40_PGU022290 [Platanthera guangdongensis]|uniref:Uncharacterized protein n=1 Tax=Platanthera guangdongensis TaxID=2320717 RepID=A0ABR2M512_9ASPA